MQKFKQKLQEICTENNLPHFIKQLNPSVNRKNFNTHLQNSNVKNNFLIIQLQ